MASTAALRICSTCVQTGGNLSRYGYVILNSWDAPLLPALKAANPGLKALVYKNLSFTDSYGCSNGVDQARLSTGVGYCDADHNHPDWFLTDSSGGRLNSYYFPDARMMDVGSSAYQSKWLSNVLADLRAGGWAGVFMDDTNTDMSWHLHGRTIAKYPTSASWRAATRSMLAAVGPALRSAGLLAMPNLYIPWAGDYDAQATWSDWLQFTSGGVQEFYRYMIDAAAIDFGASTDHQAGGTDYWAFMTQKMADMYHFPQRFVPFYAYERNLGNPFGHRNIVHTKRDYPIVPFLLLSIVARGMRFYFFAFLLHRYGVWARVNIEKRLGLWFTIAVLIILAGVIAATRLF